MRPMFLSSIASVALFLPACVEAPDDGVTTSEAPLIGIDGSRDQADRGCHVVLRELTRLGNGTGGYQEQNGSWIWQGDLELSSEAAAEGATASVLYQYGSDPTWWRVDATPSTSPATPGFARYRVRLDHHLPGPGMSGTALSTARVQVVPYAQLVQGGRRFDHNRHPGDFDNYLLAGSTDFAVRRNDAACPSAGPTPPARIVFAADQSETQLGALVPGGQVRLEYDVNRLTTCRNSRGGNDLWDIAATVRWEPSGESMSATVKHGMMLVDIPREGARRMQVWFENTAVPGCRAWDSNLGANYGFDILVPPAWIGAPRVKLSRDTNGACDGAVDASTGFTFETWPRQRAATTSLCFKVWSPGVTDRDDAELWKKLDATVRWRPRGSTEPLQTATTSLDGRVGNDARFVVNVRGLDPFRPYHCPGMPVTSTPDGQYVAAELEYVIIVNGVELRAPGGDYFVARFLDYRTDPWRDANC